MSTSHEPLKLDQPATYRIEVQGRLNPAWTTRFDDMVIFIPQTSDKVPITVLTGVVADQAALFGLLSRIRDLGLPLLSVNYIDQQ
ncbi:MAG TPA: hypothetical protein VGK81_12445 [Anaerolineae bacterium]